MADIFTVLEELADCLCTQIKTDGLLDPCFCGVVPGTAVVYGYAEDCDKGGVAWVRLENIYPSVSVGQQQIDLNNCSGGLGFDVEVGILRPMPLGDEYGNMPASDLLTSTTSLQVADAITMRKAIVCCMQDRGWILGAYTPMGPEGGVVGGAWNVNMADF